MHAAAMLARLRRTKRSFVPTSGRTVRVNRDFDVVAVVAALVDSLDEDSGEVDVFGGNAALRHELFDFDNRDLGRHRHEGREVAGRLLEPEIAPGVSALGFDDREVGFEGQLQQTGPVEFADFFPISNQRRGVTPLVLLLKRSGNHSANSRNNWLRSSSV